MRALIAALASAAFCGVACVPASADTVRSCPGNHPLGGSGPIWYGDLSVRNLSCSTGHSLLRRASYRYPLPVVAGFTCRQVGTYGDGAIYRCVSEARAIRFSAGG